jgi:ribokinase
LGRVYVVGSTNVDRTVRVDRLPAAGETAMGDSVRISAGGKGANAAAAAARAGATVTFVSAVGDDADGRAAIDALRSEGVEVDGMTVIAQAATGAALIVTDAAGANLIAVGTGANARLTPADVTAALRGLGADDALLVSAEIPDPCIEAALRCGSERGAVTVLDPAPARRSLLGFAGHGPILTPNESEAALLTGEDDPEAGALMLNRLTGRPVIITLGPAGCLVHDGQRATRHPAAPAPVVVDSVGAGDAVAGALAAGLTGRRPLPAAVTKALDAAARSLAHPGARPPATDVSPEG